MKTMKWMRTSKTTVGMTLPEVFLCAPGEVEFRVVADGLAIGATYKGSETGLSREQMEAVVKILNHLTLTFRQEHHDSIVG